MGAVYRALRERFGQAINLQVVDPRNIALWVMMVRDSFAHRVGLRDGLRTFATIPRHGLVMNGRIVDAGERRGIGRRAEHESCLTALGFRNGRYTVGSTGSRTL